MSKRELPKLLALFSLGVIIVFALQFMQSPSPADMQRVNQVRSQLAGEIPGTINEVDLEHGIISYTDVETGAHCAIGFTDTNGTFATNPTSQVCQP